MQIMSEKEKIVAIFINDQKTKNSSFGIKFSRRVKVFKINERLEVIRKEIDIYTE